MTADTLAKIKMKVYAKLSLDEGTIQKILPQADVVGPIKRYDLANDCAENYAVIIIIDGQFHNNLAVSCDEIRDALHRGTKIYGAASMGALRASELDSCGMIGHGEIYEHIKVTPYFRDDWLGQVFVEKAGRVHTLIPPFVDFYFNLKSLLQLEEISRKEFGIMTKSSADLFYSERSWDKVKAAINREKCRQPAKLLAIAERAWHQMGSQKQRDALSLCKKVQRDLQKIAAANQKLNWAL